MAIFDLKKKVHQHLVWHIGTDVLCQHTNWIELQQKNSYPYQHRDPCPVDLFGNVMQNDRHEDMNLPVQSPKAFPHILRPRVGVRPHRLHQPRLGQLSQTTQSTSPCLPLACLFISFTFKMSVSTCHITGCLNTQTGLEAHREKVG